MMALVRSVIAASMASGSIFSVAGSRSAKTGVAPVWMMTLAVEGHVIGEVITSSPGPTSSATSDKWRAAGRPEGSQSTRWEGNPPGTFSRTNLGRPSGPLHLLDPLEPSSVERGQRRREPGRHNISTQGQLLDTNKFFKEL